VEPGFVYEVFGLRVGSEFALWPAHESFAASPQSAVPDAVIRVAAQALPQPLSESFEIGQASAVIRWPRVGVLRVQYGSELCWWPEAGASEQALSLLSAGMGLAMLLCQRDRLVLHGACVLTPHGDARCLIGTSGAGKSSLVSALLARGWSLLSDAMTVVEFDRAGCAFALRGAPFLRLWPDALERAELLAQDFPRVTAEHDKRVVPARNWSTLTRVPLTHIYELRAGAVVGSRACEGAVAALTLVKHHFLAELLGQRSSARLLTDASRALRHVALHELCRGQNPADIERAADCV